MSHIKNINIVLIFGSIVVLVSHVFFSVALYDGTHDLFRMMTGKRFYSEEISRKFFNIFQALPTDLFINSSSFTSLNFLITVFSFGMVWIHILSLIGCYYILPKNKKHLIFFPLLAFLAGPAVSLHISISKALSVCSYIWLVAYIVHYSDLSRKIHKILLIIVPLPLILSHELMSYMAWPLIILCWYKNITEKNQLNKILVNLVMSFLFIISVTQTFMTLFHDKITTTGPANDLSSVIDTIIYFDFLFKPEFNKLLCFIILTIGLLFIPIYKDYTKHKIKNIFLFSSFIVAFLAVMYQTVNGFVPDYNIRFYPPVVALPLCFLLWWMYVKKNKVNMVKKSKFLLYFFVLAVIFYRVNFDYKFYKYQIQISKYLNKCTGAFQLEKIDSISSQDEELSFLEKYTRDDSFNNKLLDFHSWQMLYISFIYPRTKIIKSIILPPSLAPIRDDKICARKNENHENNCSQLYKINSELTTLNETRFVNTPEIMDIESISKCQK